MKHILGGLCLTIFVNGRNKNICQFGLNCDVLPGIKK